MIFLRAGDFNTVLSSLWLYAGLLQGVFSLTECMGAPCAECLYGLPVWCQAGPTGHRQGRLMTGKAGLGQAILDGADYRNDKVVARAGYMACS